ncbi:39S ribosomal protein L54, mitochondrial [Orussus abietinus]|uniref:39S ribosomal protein L54, mitochondrial n=1 Tax=Orussus abietinus TaxID=222816 RepID=UPI0006251458|nr:39S ribosomal protein L54, mitochondrial [Orussus abietinus]
MNLLPMFSLLQFQRNLLALPLQYGRQFRGYAVEAPFFGKSKKKKGGPVGEKKEIPVETDVSKLLTFVCGSNILKEGKDVELKPDSEYPDWLWTIKTGPLPPLEEMDPDSLQYWRRVRKLAMARNNQLAKLKKF